MLGILGILGNLGIIINITIIERSSEQKRNESVI